MTHTKEKKPEKIVFVAAFSAFLATFNETFLNVAFYPVMDDFGVKVSTVLAAAITRAAGKSEIIFDKQL